MAAKESNIKAKENSVIDPNINVLRDAVNKLFSASYELRQEFERGLKQAGDGIAENRVRIIKAEKRIEGIEGLGVRSLSPDAPVIIAKSPYTSLMEEAFHPSIIEKMKCDVMGELRYLPWWMDNKVDGGVLDVDQREPWNMARSFLYGRQFCGSTVMFWKIFHEMVDAKVLSLNRCEGSCLACRENILEKTVVITVDDVNRMMGSKRFSDPLKMVETETPYRSLMKRRQLASLQSKTIETLNREIQELYPGAKCIIRIDTDIPSEVMS